MYVPFETLPDDSRVWIYQSSRKFSDEEFAAIGNAVHQFVDGWNAHGKPLEASNEMQYHRFIVLAVNGEVRQSDRTSRMIFSFRKIIAYISTFTTLVPGDILITGTPTGAGARFDPPIWLKPGDVVEVEAEGIGLLRNTIADEV